ncbi:MAG TPA: exopolysaccharide biosynthesis polyprenyl glycosylphosphotransferase [Thermoleophilaceae bacterium]|nr:exopolysaccharide biosynthesis polyprenyl glycosylphosphotransferase [Thermoleophilaceae bacterium]
MPPLTGVVDELAPPDRAPATPEAGEGARPARTLNLDHRYRRALALADVLACAFAVTLCIGLLGAGDQVSAGALVSLPLVVVISKLLGLYDRDELVLRKSTLEEAPRLFQLATLCTLVLWIAESPLKLGELGGDQVLALWIVLLLSLVGARVAARGLARRSTPAERCLLLGDPEACERARRKIDGSATVNAEVVAQITSVRIGETEVPLEMLAQLAADHEIQRVVIAPRSTDHGDVLNLVRAVKSIGLNVSVLPRLLEIVGSSVVVDDIEGLRVLGVARFGLTRSSRLVKRSLDVGGSSVGLLLLAPLLVVIAVAVKIGSRGPVLFRQPRIGRDGQTFSVYKFRTMVVEAEDLKEALLSQNEAEGLFKIADDPRINRVGRVLRRASVDELPQLFNVLKGEMSLVGPRPLVREDDSQIEGWDRHRLHLTPGMTGPWQILGPARLPLNEMVKLDYLYVATWSLWGDIKILVRTFAFVLGRQGL